MSATKAQNDPWSPLPEDSNGISPPPADPRHQLIDSARYIDSLEKRLKKIQGKQRPEPSSRQIIDSLASFREDQMQRFMNRDQNGTSVLLSSADTDSESAVSGSVAYIQRKLHPEKQAINMEELFELLKDDELARIRAENEEGEEKEKDRSTGSTVPNENEREKEKEKDNSTGSTVPNEKGREKEKEKDNSTGSTVPSEKECEREKDRSTGSTVPYEEEREKEKEKDSTGSTVTNEDEQEKEKVSSTGSSVSNKADGQKENSDIVSCGDSDVQNPSVE